MIQKIRRRVLHRKAFGPLLQLYPLLTEIIKTFLIVVSIMLSIDGSAQLLLRQVLIRRAGLTTVVLIQPLWADPITTTSHLLHNQAMVGIKTIGRVGKDIVHRRVLSAPAIAAQGAAFPMLPQKLRSGKLRNQGLMPKSHGNLLSVR